ncbi:unnamed protein product [Colias eurytheme]|nr:unnamed protein product [Colias eurytheme]
MSTSNDLSDVEEVPKLRMKPAVSSIFCCSVTAASGFIAAYALVSYAIALIYEIVWVVESQSGLPIASALLMICYCVVIAATVVLVHGLISKNNTYLLAWLISVILVLIPECALVFYMSISHWGLQGVYGGAELACYVARLPAIVCGVVLVQSAYALREARKAEYGTGMGVGGSEFDASHYVPEPTPAFTNEGFMPDNGKSGSMPDLRRHLASRQSHMGYMMAQPPPAYWQHLADRQYAASLRLPKHYPPPQAFGTWVGPRTGPYDKRRHSIVGAFDEYPTKYDYDDRMECKSEISYPYRQYYDPRMFPPDYERYYQTQDAYGVNLLRHDPYHFNNRDRDRSFYAVRNSHTSVGNESDDLTKYKDVAL